MDASSIISLALTQTYSDTNQISAADLLTYLNISYHNMSNTITEALGEDYFYELFTTDTVADQAEYSFETSTATQQGLKKVLSVELKRASTDTYYTLLTNVKNTSYLTPLDKLAVDLPASRGIYDIKDSSLFIYPTPEESVTDGLRIQALVNLIDLTATDEETAIFPKHSELRERHYILALGMKPYIFQSKGLISEKQLAQQDYELELQKMVRGLVRYKGPVTGTTPDLSYYKN